MSYPGAEFPVGERSSPRRTLFTDTSGGQHQDGTLDRRRLQLGGAAVKLPEEWRVFNKQVKLLKTAMNGLLPAGVL